MGEGTLLRTSCAVFVAVLLQRSGHERKHRSGLRRDHAIRIASLAIMILTAAKVFLYDASQLEGLMRVLSFLGLGLSLLGISWFYTRFVFHAAAAGGGSGDSKG
jgi:uncharacterized membrane protein